MSEIERFELTGCQDLNCMCGSSMELSDDGCYVKYEAHRARLQEAEHMADEIIALRETLSKAKEAANKEFEAFERASNRIQVLEKQIILLRNALEDFGVHQSGCILAYLEGGEPFGKGYRWKYKGKWYNQHPPCQCGYSEALSSIPELKKKRLSPQDPRGKSAKEE